MHLWPHYPIALQGLQSHYTKLEYECKNVVSLVEKLLYKFSWHLRSPKMESNVDQGSEYSQAILPYPRVPYA